LETGIIRSRRSSRIVLKESELNKEFNMYYLHLNGITPSKRNRLTSAWGYSSLFMDISSLT